MSLPQYEEIATKGSICPPQVGVISLSCEFLWNLLSRRVLGLDCLRESPRDLSLSLSFSPFYWSMVDLQCYVGFRCREK